jgi:hypothetical protein
MAFVAVETATHKAESRGAGYCRETSPGRGAGREFLDCSPFTFPSQ